MGLFGRKKEGLLEQMEALESWALSAHKESKKDNPDLDKIQNYLRKIDSQASKIKLKIPKNYSWRVVEENLDNILDDCQVLEAIRRDKSLSNLTKKSIKEILSSAIIMVNRCAELEK